MQGVQLAHGSGDIPAEFFDAVTCCKEEAAELEYKINKARQLGRWMPGA